jgi:hypothetical protein
MSTVRSGNLALASVYLVVLAVAASTALMELMVVD